VSDAALEELLRRCHRDELLHLAAVLRVDPDKKGLRDLATALARKLRWVGSHKLRALFRRGRSNEYHAVLAELARRAKVKPGTSLELTEQAILAKYVTQAWARLDDDARLRFWSEQGLRPPVPKVGQQALEVARDSLGEQASYALSTLTVPGVLALVTIPITPLPGCLLAWWLASPNDRVLVPAVLEVSRLRQLVLHRVTIGIVGSPSSGKDAAIKAIFGIDHGNIDPVAGSTKEVSITRIPGSTATYVINTPGLGDVVESVTEEARQVLDHIDVYVYVVNAQGGVQQREKADYSACVRSGRPVLTVVNKIDTLKESDRARYLADARQKLGAPQDAFLAAAFDPLPQLSDRPLGVVEIRSWLRTRLLEAGKSPRELGFGQSVTGTTGPDPG
jgi:GTP-binding protein EngB required for normal cell division